MAPLMKSVAHPLRTSLAIGVMLALSGVTNADQWQLTPNAELEMRYDDNITLSPTNSESVFGTFLKGQLTFSRLTEISTISGRLSAEYSHYDDPPAGVKADNTNVFLDINSEFRTELSRYGLLGLIRRDTTLRFTESVANEAPGETDDPITDEPVAIDGIDLDRGLVQQEIDRETFSLSPYWSLDLNERSTIDLTYRYTDARYKDNPTGSGIFDYESHDVSSAYEYQLNEKDKIGVRVLLGRFKSPDNSNNTVDTYGLTGIFSRKFSETLDGELELGVNHFAQDSDFTTTTNKGDGIIVGIRLNKRTETDRYGLSISRNIQPSGDGTASETNQINLRARRDLNERLNIQASLSYAETEQVGVSNSKRDYFYFNPRMDWKMTQEWTVGVGYRYIRNDDAASQSADSNSVFLSLKYTEPYFLE